MGAKSSKLQPHRIEPEVTAVEVFPDTVEARQGNGSPKRQKVSTPTQGGTAHVVRSNLHDTSDTASNKVADTETQEEAKAEKQKKKRRRSKKDKNKSPPPTLVRAQTQLNELKNVKPLLQQSPQARQQHFEQIKDAYALDEEARKAPPQDGRSRFFNFDSWRKTPSEKGDSPGREPTAPLTRSQSSGTSRGLFASTGGSVRSSRGTEEISNDIEDLEDSREVESLVLPPPSRTTAITAPTVITSPTFLAASNQVEYGRPDIQTTPVIRVKTSDRRTPERSKRPSQHSDLRLDDVDEDLMEHILTND